MAFLARLSVNCLFENQKPCDWYSVRRNAKRSAGETTAFESGQLLRRQLLCFSFDSTYSQKYGVNTKDVSNFSFRYNPKENHLQGCKCAPSFSILCPIRVFPYPFPRTWRGRIAYSFHHRRPFCRCYVRKSIEAEVFGNYGELFFLYHGFPRCSSDQISVPVLNSSDASCKRSRAILILSQTLRNFYDVTIIKNGFIKLGKKDVVWVWTRSFWKNLCPIYERLRETILYQNHVLYFLIGSFKKFENFQLHTGTSPHTRDFDKIGMRNKMWAVLKLGTLC